MRTVQEGGTRPVEFNFRLRCAVNVELCANLQNSKISDNTEWVTYVVPMIQGHSGNTLKQTVHQMSHSLSLVERDQNRQVVQLDIRLRNLPTLTQSQCEHN